MNDFFSFSRLGLLLKKFIKEHLYIYLLYIAGLFGLLFIIYGLVIFFNLEESFPEDIAPVFYVFGLLLSSFIFSSSFYSFFNNKAKGIQFLNLPSSHTEKLALGFIFTQIVFFLTYTLVFFILDRIMGGIYDHFHTIKATVPREAYKFYKSVPLDFKDKHVVAGIVISVALSAVAHFGSLLFEKHAFIKSALIVTALGFLFIYYNFFFMKSLIPEDSMPGGMFYTQNVQLNAENSIRYEDEMKIANNTIKGIVMLPKFWDNFVYWFLPSMVYLFFWTASYFKLKEKQV